MTHSQETCISTRNLHIAFLARFLEEVLPSDVTHSAVMPHYVCLSVRPSVMFIYPDHIGWKTSKMISRLIS